MAIIITSDTRKSDAWVRGSYNKFSFSAKVFDLTSEFGINEGRVSKLFIRDTEKNCTVCSYDRGWDIDPSSAASKSVYAEILNFLENLNLCGEEE